VLREILRQLLLLAMESATCHSRARMRRFSPALPGILEWLSRPLCVIIFFGACLFLSSCPGPANETGGAMVNRMVAYPLTTPGLQVLTAKAWPGEQMVGGGFRMTAAVVQTGGVAFVSSYPSAIDTWTVELFVSQRAATSASDAVVFVDCYCYTNPARHLGMAVASNQPHTAQLTTSGGTLDFVDSCPAPSNAVVTDGGWRITVPPDFSLDNWEVMINANGGLWGSYPQVNTAGAVTGWSTHYVWPFATFAPAVTTYTLYSTGIFKPPRHPTGDIPKAQRLTPGPVKTAPLNVAGNLPSGTRFGRADCDPGYFASGGGFQFANLPPSSNPNNTGFAAQPRWMYSNTTLFALPEYDPGNPTHTEFAGWSFFAFGAHEFGSPATSTGEAAAVWLVQIANLPRPVTVKITSPPDGTIIEIYDSKNVPLQATQPITFVAEAYDEDGSKILDDSSYSWNIAGVSSGEGKSITTPVKVSGGTFDPTVQTTRYKITVTAKGKNGGFGSATISLLGAIHVL
jgi:hypothetical protein